MFRQTSRILAAVARAQHQLQIAVPSRSVKRWVSPTMREIKKRREMLGPDPLPNRKTFIEWNNSAELYAFGQRLHEHFEDSLLQQAFTHRSYIVQEELRQQQHGIETPITNLKDNQPLIATGESLLTEHTNLFLLAHYPRLPAAGVLAIQDYLLSESVLANVSSHLGTKDLILSAEFPVDSSTLASTIKAVIGALAESSGPERVFAFIRDFVCTQLNQTDVNELWTIGEPFSLLQEVCKNESFGAPEPRMIGETGKNTILACYQVGIYCDKRMLGTGFGENVDTAIEVAARNCLAKIFATGNSRPLNFKISPAECYELAQQHKSKKAKSSSHA